jgi:hypothetical protein
MNQRLRGMYHLHFQDKKSVKQETSMLAGCMADFQP